MPGPVRYQPIRFLVKDGVAIDRRITRNHVKGGATTQSSPLDNVRLEIIFIEVTDPLTPLLLGQKGSDISRWCHFLVPIYLFYYEKTM